MNEQINIEETDLKNLFWDMQKEMIRLRKVIENLQLQIIELTSKKDEQNP